ncbi:DNA-processing protein DprA [soil metagenome]
MALSASALEPLLRLAVVPGIGPARLATLLERFGSADRVLAASREEIATLPGFGTGLVGLVRAAAEAPGLQRARTALDTLRRCHAVAITPDDLDYPETLQRLADPPFLLYSTGRLELLKRPAVAIVGTRNPTPYGRSTAAALGRDLARAGYVIVSGMAKGIDAAAQAAALEVDGGTIGVLGHGVEQVYPAENRALFREVAERGLLITEFAPGERLSPGNFPRRNRIIAALGLVVVVVEMSVRSGAQHTVTAALDLGHDVFAVPGPIGSLTSEGTNQLIKEGARVLTSVDDILEELQGVGRSAAAAPPAPKKRSVPAPPHGSEAPAAPAALPEDLSPDEKRLLSTLGDGPRHVDELTAAAGLSPAQVLSTLLGLELRGLVEALPGKNFRRA